MKIITKFYEYIFYRITKAYFKWDGSEGMTAIIVISLSQTLLICDIIGFIVLLLLSRTEISEYTKIATTIGVILLIFLLIVNFLKFKNKYNDYHLRWENEKSNRRKIKGVLVVLLSVLPLIIAFILGSLQF